MINGGFWALESGICASNLKSEVKRIQNMQKMAIAFHHHCKMSASEEKWYIPTPKFACNIHKYEIQFRNFNFVSNIHRMILGSSISSVFGVQCSVLDWFQICWCEITIFVWPIVANCLFFHFSENENSNIEQRRIQMDSYGIRFTYHRKW